MGVLRTGYETLLAAARSRYAAWVLGIVSFLESIIFPIPPDVLLIPMVVASRRRAFRYATICTLCSVAGGALGYMLGFYLYSSLGPGIVSLLDLEAHAERFMQIYHDYGHWAVLVAGFTPVPYKVATILSGVAGYPMASFLAASFIARGCRFFLITVILWKYGSGLQEFVERRLGLVTLAMTGVIAVLILIGSMISP